MSRARRCPTRRRRRRCASFRSGTTRCSRGRTVRAFRPEEYRRVVIGQNGDVAQTFLVDGFVAGTWRAERGRVTAEPFAKLSRPAQRELEDETARLEAFLSD